MPDSKRIYLDYNASTPLLSEGQKAVEENLALCGNPSSIHQSARELKSLIWEARKNLADFISCHPLEIIFTSGASESNNYALKGIRKLSKENNRNEIIVSSVEHSSVFRVAEYLHSQGMVVHYIPVSHKKGIDENAFKKSLNEKTLLVSIMLANNETGHIFPIKKLVKMAHEAGAIFHSDMVQALGKIPLDIKDLGVDIASFSAHKFYGLKGCGAMYSKKHLNLESLIHGGGQERGRRAGTENVTGITSFSESAKKGSFILEENKNIIQKLRDELETNLLLEIPNIEIIGKDQPRLGNTSCIFIEGIYGETLLMNLDLDGVSVSVGSACNSGKMQSNSVLIAMGLEEEQAKNSLRISLGLGIKRENIKKFVQILSKTIKRLRNL